MARKPKNKIAVRAILNKDSRPVEKPNYDLLAEISHQALVDISQQFETSLPKEIRWSTAVNLLNDLVGLVSRRYMSTQGTIFLDTADKAWAVFAKLYQEEVAKRHLDEWCPSPYWVREVTLQNTSNHNDPTIIKGCVEMLRWGIPHKYKDPEKWADLPAVGIFDGPVPTPTQAQKTPQVA